MTSTLPSSSLKFYELDYILIQHYSFRRNPIDETLLFDKITDT